MQSTHVGLYSYLPLSLEGPKGEGDKGGEGSPVGLGRCLPKCDTNPLTLPEHPCYYPHRSNTNLTISRRNQKPREAHPIPPEDSTSKPIPTALRVAQALWRLKQTPPSPHPHGSRAPFPDSQAMERRPGSLSFMWRLPRRDPAPSSGIAVGRPGAW